MSEENNIKELLDDINRQYQNRSWWRKFKDFWLYPKGHRQIAINERSLTVDQYLLLRIHQQQIRDSAITHRLLMLTLLLVAIGFITLIIMLLSKDC
jgi:hypothetical protein